MIEQISRYPKGRITGAGLGVPKAAMDRLLKTAK